MRLANPRLWIGVVSLLAVLSFAVVDMGRTSPGELATVHLREPDLEGRGGCSECHGGWRSTMTESCLYCHEAVAKHIDERTGLHGRLAPEKVERCASCHSDHHGAGFSMVNRASFAKAGVPHPEEFDHRLVGYEMAGKHLELECSKCHPNAEEKVLPEGGRRFLGLERDCASCHEDPHRGRMALACADCHGQESWGRLEFARHDEILPLTGGHAAVGCRECHGAEEPHALEVVGFGTGDSIAPGRRDCADCHDSPHRDAFVLAAADRVRLSPGAACADCHEASHESFRDERLDLGALRHASSGFPLDAPHHEAACEDCHADGGRDFAERYPGRAALDCKACHDDPHGGQFAASPPGRRECVDCHERQAFAPHAFTSEKHALTRLPLDGAHLASECAACHAKPDEETPRSFHGTASRCEACHEDAHGGFFAAGVSGDETAVERGACAPCHSTESFSDATSRGFDHGRWTRFPLAGAHAEAECESCHEPAAAPDRAGRDFGRIRDLHGPVTGCDTCHRDPHAGAFDAKGRPKEVGGRAGCLRCHGTVSFRATETPFDHGLWTGFPLSGAHGEAACSSCHAPLVRQDALARTRGRARGAACADCHEDRHAGQFAEGGRVDCRRCHESTERFADLAFNHNIESKFALGETHGSVPCASCHKPFDHRGAEVVRYKPLPVECVDCHGDNADPLKRRRDGVKR